MKTLSRSLLTLALVAFIACGDDDSMVRPDAGTPPPPASLAEAVAFEGMRSFVTEVTLSDGTSLEGATITPAEGAPFEILEQRCVAERCGLVLAVLDTRPNRGVGVPATIDAVNHFLRVQTTSTLYQALLPVRPLDEVTGRGVEPSTFREPIILATNVVIDPGAALQPGSLEPTRWVVFGDVQIAGTLNASARDMIAGGGAGGAAGVPGEGLGEGGAGGGEAGGGGAGHAEMGGMGATGEGGAPYGTPSVGCVSDFSQLTCGGSGGGGDTGAGGDGAGGVFVVSLGTFTLDGVIAARGGDGIGGGGGGSGGSIHLAAPAFAGSGEIDVAGGAGDGTGGSGSPGRVRVDTPGGGPSGYLGLAVSLVGVPRIVESGTVSISGVAPVNAAIEVHLALGSRVADGSADASGAFEVEVPLSPGLNRLVIEAVDSEGTRTRNWVGTNIRFERVDGRMAPVPTAATVDVVRLR